MLSGEGALLPSREQLNRVVGALSNLFQDQHLQRLHSQRVSLRPQPRHDGGRRHRDIGAVINWLAAMNVADVKFYNRPLEHLEGV